MNLIHRLKTRTLDSSILNMPEKLLSVVVTVMVIINIIIYYYYIKIGILGS
jgi:hypothetical protein